MRGHRDRLRTGDEYDLASRMRGLLKFMRRPGVTARIKAGIDRRARQEAKADVEDRSGEPGGRGSW